MYNISTVCSSLKNYRLLKLPWFGVSVLKIIYMQCNMSVHLICGVYYSRIFMTTCAIRFTMYVLFFILSLLNEHKIDNILSLQREVLYRFTFVQHKTTAPS